jgi:hypothetical protein
LFAIAALASFFAFVGSAAGEYKFAGSFSGGPGSGDGEMDTPGRAAVEQSTGNLFIADSGNDRVEVFKRKASGVGEYLTQFGGGELSEPWGIAIDEDAGTTFVYVADAGNERIVKYESDGAATPGFSVDPSFTSPSASEVGDFHAALAIDPSTHDLLVADPGKNEIERFESDGTAVSSFDGSAGAGSPGAFTNLLDLAVNSSGDVYVIDANGPDIREQQGTSKALRYSAAGQYKATLGPVGERERVATVAVDPDTDEVLVSGEQDAVYEEGPEPYVPALQLFDSANDPLATPSVNGGAAYDTVTGLAFDVGGGRFYVVLDQGHWNGSLYGSVQVQSFAVPTPPDVTIDPVDPGTVTVTEAEVTGTVDAHEKVTSYAFEYRQTGEADWTSVPTWIASADGPEAVSQKLTELAPNTDYEVRLVASNSDGESTTVPVTFSTDVSPPFTVTQAAWSVNGDSAILRALINPAHEPTSYHFEWGPSDCSANACASLPAGPEEDAGSGNQLVEVSSTLSGLSPNTTYHYRIVAHNGTGASAGGDHTFTTESPFASCPNLARREEQGAGLLPSCRAWEIVSPPVKNGYPAEAGNDNQRIELTASADGKRVTYVTAYPLDTGLIGSIGAFSSSRDTAGWSTASVLQPPSGMQSGRNLFGSLEASLRGSTPDQKAFIYWDGTTEPYGGLWKLELGQPKKRIADATAFQSEGTAGNKPNQPWFEGVSDDGDHVVFADTDRLLPGLPAGENEILYEWIDDGSNGGAGSLRVVNRTNAPGLTLIEAGEDAELGGAARHNSVIGAAMPGGTRHAISSDGRYIFFQTPPSVGNDLGGQPRGGGPLYVRIGGQQTKQVSAPAPGYTPTNPVSKVQYLDAAVDGRVVYFWADGDLAAGAPSEGGVYRYTTASSSLEFVAATNGVVPTAMASDDGSHLYFEGIGGLKLAIGSTVTSLPGTGSIRLAGARLGFGGELDGSTEQDGLHADHCTSADISPDGRYLAFTGYESRPNGTATIQESAVYRYDAQTNVLTNVSPTRAESPGRRAATFSPVMCPSGWSSRVGEGRVMSDDGQYVFFATPMKMAPQDVNGSWDVYQWHNGNVSLVSDGTSPLGSMLSGTDGSGENVYFLTRSPLSWEDPDPITDLYTARIGGGIAKPLPLNPCEGEACQGAGSSPPAVPRAGTARFKGPGNKSARKPAKHKKQAKKKRAKHKKQARKHAGKRAGHKQGGTK